MTGTIDDIVEVVTLDSQPAIGIALALLGGVFLSLGAQFQHRGVAKVERARDGAPTGGLQVRQLLRLLGRPSWVLGTAMLALAIVLQLTSLNFAPLIVVQPLGVVALIITSILNARVSRIRLTPPGIRAIALCVLGIGAFVTIAAFVARDTGISEQQLLIILIILGVVLVLLLSAFLAWRRRVGAVFYILAAGVLYGFVATLAKVVITRIRTGDFEWLTLLCVVALIAAAALGAYFVQTAYSVGSPDLVIAGLTVVDPIVAVTIGVTVLGEAAGAPALAVIAFLASGVLAVFGVFQLAKHHPQTRV